MRKGAVFRTALTMNRDAFFTINKYLIILMSLTSIGVFATTSSAGIEGSKHDFSNESFSENKICSICHVPHDADNSLPMLWNHQITTATFTVYSSTTLDAVDMEEVGTLSKLCLSCHDGTVAIDSFGKKEGKVFIDAESSKNIGTNLFNDHPVSFSYNAALAEKDGELYDPTKRSSGLGSTIQNDLLYNGKFECTSCHDPHDNSNGSFLRASNDGSKLCLICHIK